MANRFCSNCGTPNSEEAKFCVSCGTPAAAPQPVQPPTAPMEQPPAQPVEQPMQLQPQPFPQFPQNPQPYQQAQPYAQPYPMAPAPAKKKKRKGLVVLGVLGGLVLLIIIIAASALSKAGGADYYKVKDDQVPSINYVLQEERKLIRTETSVRNGMTIVSREYNSSTPQQDMDTYFNYLAGNAGWTPVYDGNMDFAGVGRNSVTPGYQLEVQAAYSATGYTISVYYLQGQLEMLN